MGSNASRMVLGTHLLSHHASARSDDKEMTIALSQRRIDYAMRDIGLDVAEVWAAPHVYMQEINELMLRKQQQAGALSLPHHACLRNRCEALLIASEHW